MAPSEVLQGNPFGRSKVGTRRLAMPARIAARAGENREAAPGSGMHGRLQGRLATAVRCFHCTPGISGAGLILRSLSKFAELIHDVSHGPGLSVEFLACTRTLFCTPAQTEAGRSRSEEHTSELQSLRHL